MIERLGETLTALKPQLRKYLEMNSTKFSGKFLTCPNKKQHKHMDLKPSANFYPDNEHIRCFSCGFSGDILSVCNVIEGKPITGSGFHDTIVYLCQKLGVPFQVSKDHSMEGQFINELEVFISGLVGSANTSLLDIIKNNPDHAVVNFLKTKDWLGAVDTFKLGTVTKVNKGSVDPKIQNFCDFLNLNLSELIDSIVIPVYYSGKIVGFQARNINPGPNEAKYKMYLSTNKVLFNLDAINPNEPVYIVEGASSVIVLSQYGVKNVVATLGNNLNEDNYMALINREVKEAIILYDADEGGQIGRERACKMVLNKRDLNMKIMLLSEENDPADYISKFKTLEALKPVEFWDYLLQLNNKEYLMTYVANEQDLLKKEKLLGVLSKHLDATKGVLIEEVQKYEKSDTSSIQTLKEKEALVEGINAFEKWAWTRGSQLGLQSFPCFNKAFDGLQEGLILFGGNPNVGKSLSCVSLVIEILKNNPDVYVVYMTIDDSILITMSRFLANLSGIPINTVSNPKYKIMNNPDLTEEVKKDMLLRRERALVFMRDQVSMFNLKDAADGYTLEYLTRLLKTSEPLFKDKKLLIVVDNLHKLSSDKYFKKDKFLVDQISSQLKLFSGIYRCPVIATAEYTKDAIKNGDREGSALKETSSLQYDANLILTINLKEDLPGGVRLLDLVVSKNKFSTFIGNLNFKAYPALSKLEEDLGANSHIFE